MATNNRNFKVAALIPTLIMFSLVCEFIVTRYVLYFDNKKVKNANTTNYTVRCWYDRSKINNSNTQQIK